MLDNKATCMGMIMCESGTMSASRRHVLRGIGSLSVVAAADSLWAGELPGLSAHGDLGTGGNPIVTSVGLCDPHIRVYDDHVYLYATHDADPKNTDFVMHNWWVWHSEDLVNWQHVSTLMPEQTYWGKASAQCWATDAMRRNGKYYFYFSRGPEEIGVVQGDSARGPWHDPLGKPLIGRGSTPTPARDPGILQEENGTSYIIFGVWDYYIARLGEDMISLAETPRKIVLDRKMGPYGPGKTDDKPYLHKRKGVYYLSWGCYYAMSDNVYGPYVYKDSIIRPNHTAPAFRDRLMQEPHIYNALTLDRHASFFELHGQWYFICNDQAWPGTQMYFRDSTMGYLHYRDNGEIETVELNREGVGQYDGRAPRLAAANYFAAKDSTVAQCPEGGYEVCGISSASSLFYPKVRHLTADSTLSLRASCAHARGCTVEIYADPLSHDLLGSLHFPPTGSWKSYRTISTQMHRIKTETGIHLRFKASQTESLRLQWLQFS